jgi:hypothetical protein
MNPFDLLRTTDRRLGARYSPRKDTTATCHRGTLGLGRDLALSVLDLSDIGGCLVLGEPLDRGQVVEVALLAPGWAAAVKRLGVIVWSEASGTEGYEAGIIFSRSLEFNDLRDLCYLPEF